MDCVYINMYDLGRPEVAAAAVTEEKKSKELVKAVKKRM